MVLPSFRKAVRLHKHDVLDKYLSRGPHSSDFFDNLHYMICTRWGRYADKVRETPFSRVCKMFLGGLGPSTHPSTRDSGVLQ